MKAKILAPEPGTQAPNKQAATLSAVLVHLLARWSGGTGQGSFCSSSSTFFQFNKFIKLIKQLHKKIIL